MYTIKTMNAISPVGLAKLPANQFEINNEADDAQGILVRSADLHLPQVHHRDIRERGLCYRVPEL